MGKIVQVHCFPQCFLSTEMSGKLWGNIMFPHRANCETFQCKQIHSGLSPGRQAGKHLLPKENVSEKNQKHFNLFLGNKKCFCNKCFMRVQMGNR